MENNLKIYLDSNHYRKEYRTYLADILRPYINARSLKENIQMYGKQVLQYELVSDPEEADLHVLTMTWGYYFETGQLKKAKAFIRKAQSISKPIAIWQNGDFSVRLTEKENVSLFQCGGQRSSRNFNQFAQPVFIGDPWQELNLSRLLQHPKKVQPIVGFCGQADYTFRHAAVTKMRFGLHNIKSFFKLTPYELLPFDLLPTRLRSQVLHILEECTDIQTNFIKRKKYRAGARTVQERKIIHQEFLQNMIESDYIVCVRGTGNFSTRLYETLAMGRIPILIDTDCILPYESSINWKEYCVIVDVKDLNSLPQRVLEFHTRLDQAEFSRHQLRCRKLWEERLSFSGFFKHFPEHFT